MKKLLLFAAAILIAGGSRAQNVAIGGRAPELRTVQWLTPQPAAAPLTATIFVHTTDGSTASLMSGLHRLSTMPEVRVIVVAEESETALKPLVADYSGVRFAAAVDPAHRTFAAFGVQYVPFALVTDLKNRVVWMGDPTELTPSFIGKIR